MGDDFVLCEEALRQMLLKAARVWYLKLTLMVLRVAIDVCQLQTSVQRWHILPRPIVSEQPPCHGD
jgi:hypothetical protein